MKNNSPLWRLSITQDVLKNASLSRYDQSYEYLHTAPSHQPHNYIFVSCSLVTAVNNPWKRIFPRIEQQHAIWKLFTIRERKNQQCWAASGGQVGRADGPTDAVSHPRFWVTYIYVQPAVKGVGVRGALLLYFLVAKTKAHWWSRSIYQRVRPLFASRDRGAVSLFVIILIKLSARCALGFN